MANAYIQSFLNTALGTEPARNFTIYAPSNFSIITGYYAANDVLTDVSLAAVISVIDSPASNSIQANGSVSNNFYLLQPGPYTFLVTYTDNNSITYSYFLSFTAVTALTLPSELDIYNIIKRSEPQQVYTQVQTFLDALGNIIVGVDYTDVTSIANVFAELYGDMTTVYNNILPSGGNVNWEQTLNGTNGLISNQEFSNIVLQMLYSLLVQNTGNKYDVSLYLSKYIWYRTNGTVEAYVYIEEVTIVNYLFWILGISLLGVNTYLNSSPFTPYTVGIYIIPQNNAVISQAMQMELENLVYRVLPFGFTYEMFFNQTLADLGLVQFVPQAYKTDVQITGSGTIFNQFGLLYVPTNVEQASAYINPFAPQNLVSLTMSPPSGTNFLTVEPDTPYPYTIMGLYLNGLTQDLTNVTTTFSSNINVMQIGGRGILLAEGNGTVNINYSYGLISGYNTYTVTFLNEWILNESALNYTTILTGTSTGNWILDISELDINATLS